jgi:uncharacterized protein YbjT (DUF2867 family)
MKKILLFGASGNLGQQIARTAKEAGHELTVVVRNRRKAEQLSGTTRNAIIADITQCHELKGICTGFDVVISALGKSVSPNDKSRPSFTDIDFSANSFILDEAVQSGIKKFVYVSAFNAERYLHLEYFKAHHDFTEKLMASGVNYSIIKPPALFSAFLDLIDMAKKGRLMNIGEGDKKTNPIYEGDLAKICVDSIAGDKAVIEAGGAKVYTRKELNQIIQKEAAPGKRTITIPAVLVKGVLPLVKVVDRNMYAKVAFFLEVIQHDIIAPQMGETDFVEYIRRKAGS